MDNDDIGNSRLNNKLRGEFQQVLNAYDQARALLHDDENIKLMEVVVIGDRSHGKSALLSKISGVPLPSGAHASTRTRVPLRIQLTHCDSKKDEYIKIGTDENGFTDVALNEIPHHIEQLTRMLTNGSKSYDIVDKPITMWISNEKVVDLTVTDLPGIIHHCEESPQMPQVCQ